MTGYSTRQIKTDGFFFLIFEPEPNSGLPKLNLIPTRAERSTKRPRLRKTSETQLVRIVTYGAHVRDARKPAYRIHYGCSADRSASSCAQQGQELGQLCHSEGSSPIEPSESVLFFEGKGTLVEKATFVLSKNQEPKLQSVLSVPI